MKTLKEVVVVIPVYKKKPEGDSVSNCAEILNRYDFCFIAPKTLDMTEYENIFKAKNKKYTIKRFDDKYFSDVQSYSKLCLESKLYSSFRDYKYVFFFQEDGWVFKDELEYWCSKGFDYIGAPWFEGYEKSDKNSDMIEFSGNGGVSLRKVSSFIKILRREERLKLNPIRILGNLLFNNRYKTEFQKLKNTFNEDFVITGYLRNTGKERLTVAPNKEAMHFSFEVQPERLYALTGGVLPFACHGFQKYGKDFWKEHIKFPCKMRVSENFSKPVLLLTFNRLDTLKEVFYQIKAAKPKRLYVASDGPRKDVNGEAEKVLEVRNHVLSSIDWDCDVKTLFRDTNLGCQKSVSEAISWFFSNEEDGIILEDDCVPTQSFFRYCENLLYYYKNDFRISHIGGYNNLSGLNFKESYYFSTIPHVWGWASWANRWDDFSFDISKLNDNIVTQVSSNKNFQAYWLLVLHALKEGLINSWAYRWLFSLLKCGRLSIIPKYNLVRNIGDFGAHYDGEDSCLHTQTYEIGEICHPKTVKVDKKLMDKMFEEWLRIDNSFFKSIVTIGVAKMCAIVLFRSFIWKIKE